MSIFRSFGWNMGVKSSKVTKELLQEGKKSRLTEANQSSVCFRTNRALNLY